MALSRWTSTRLKVVAVVAAIAAGLDIVISWLLSHIEQDPYDFAELENGARNGPMIGGALAVVDLFYVQGPRGAWLRRLGFGHTVLARVCSRAHRRDLRAHRLIFGLLHGFECSGLDYFGPPLLRDTLLAFLIFVAIPEVSSRCAG